MMELNIGDFVKYKSHRGQIIDIREPSTCPYTGDPEPGSITIEREDGSEFMDYHYVFELDIEKIRECKLNSIGL